MGGFGLLFNTKSGGYPLPLLMFQFAANQQPDSQHYYCHDKRFVMPKLLPLEPNPAGYKKMMNQAKCG